MKCRYPLASLIPVVVGLLSLSIAVCFQTRMQRIEEEAIPRNQDPAARRFAETLGPFRSLGADLLFLHLIRQSDSRSFWELIQLSRWIGQLQPNMTGAISYLAWNMAYQTAAKSPELSTRYHWIQAGAALLREAALERGNNDRELWNDLAWIYFDKFIMPADPAQAGYFRLYFAEMSDALAQSDSQLFLRTGMERTRMKHLETTFGPIDWRLPESATLYWAQYGLAFQPEHRDVKLDRLSICALMRLTTSGNVSTGSDSVLRFEPEPHFTDSALAMARDYVERYPAFAQSVRPMLRHFLADLSLQAFWRGDMAESERRYAEFCLEPTSDPETDAPLEFRAWIEFQTRRLAFTATPRRVRAVVNGLFQRSAALKRNRQFKEAAAYERWANAQLEAWNKTMPNAPMHPAEFIRD